MITLEQVKTLLNGITIRMPVPDWNEQNDKSPNFIKNRPFYKNSSGVKKISKEFLPSVGADEVAFDQETSKLLAGAKNVQEGFRKIAEDNHFEVKSLKFEEDSIDYSVEVIGSDGNIFIGRAGNTYLITSQDGVNWQYPSNTRKSLNEYQRVVYVKGAYYLYQWEDAGFQRSLDLIHWERVNLPGSQTVLSHPYEARGRLYMGTKSDKVNILVSDDGINWYTYYQTIFDGHTLYETIGFACDDDIAVFSFRSGLKACYFDDFDNWVDSGIQYGIESNCQLGIVNGVFYRYEYGGFVFLRDKTNLNNWEQYVAPGDHMPEAFGPAAYKDGYYLFNSTGDFSDDALVYTQDFNTFQTYTGKVYYARGGVYATKKAVAVAGLTIIGPRNELGLVKEAKVEEALQEYTQNVLSPELKKIEKAIPKEKQYKKIEELELEEDTPKVEWTFDNLVGVVVVIQKSAEMDAVKISSGLFLSGGGFTSTQTFAKGTGYRYQGIARFNEGLVEFFAPGGSIPNIVLPSEYSTESKITLTGIDGNLLKGMRFEIYGLEK